MLLLGNKQLLLCCCLNFLVMLLLKSSFVIVQQRIALLALLFKSFCIATICVLLCFYCSNHFALFLFRPFCIASGSSYVGVGSSCVVIEQRINPLNCWFGFLVATCHLGPLALLFTPMLLFDSSQLRYLFDLASMCVSQILSCCCLASLVTSFGNLVFPPHLLFTSLGTMRLDPPLSCFFMYDFQTMLVILCYFVWMLMFLFHLFW